MSAGRAAGSFDVGAVEDVPEGTHVVVAAGGREIGVFNVGGRFYALPNACFHQNGPLCRGRMGRTLVATADSGWRFVWEEGSATIQCPWHQLEFDVASGRCLSFPSRRLPVYPVHVAEGRLVVQLPHA